MPFPAVRLCRGAAVDVGAPEKLLHRLSQIVTSLPELAEADLNPVLAGPYGPTALDARVRLVPQRPHDPWPDHVGEPGWSQLQARTRMCRRGYSTASVREARYSSVSHFRFGVAVSPGQTT
ncbi:acetate--CoA ligase family protein [Streptomyces sp. NPDC012751]|uniref:acetate--CoA ligase family protein n=1 Tax=Streptomyces sp. NPDC012751 TaxID=3364846 RepID=UPI0036A8152B